MHKHLLIIFLISCLYLPSYAKKPDFAREILPILSDKCFACHGPDAKKKELRLDSFEHASKDLGDYHAINPKDLDESEIIYRLNDDEDPMPPLKKGNKLSKQEKDLLTAWIKSGGKYEKHWAYVPPVKSTKHGSIDEFIKAGFAEKKIDFAPASDKATLARRASLVLTGLPPERVELKTFLEDKNPQAYEKFIDQLLARPSYGEHQARYWLDAIRYGDTHGLHLDNKRAIYPYRDWVIMAMNDNLPLDDFITWQLAGDLLPNPTLEQKVATGFVRMNPTTGEGGALEEEFQVKNNFDRVENLGTVLLGSSLLCVRCHTHKYDPIIHDEYYQLMAFFNNTAEKSVDANKYDYAPVIKAPSNIHDWKQWKKLKAQGKIVEPPIFNALLTQEVAPSKTPKNENISLYILETELFQGSIDGFRLDILNDKSMSDKGLKLDKSGDFRLKQFKVKYISPDGKIKDLKLEHASANSTRRGFSIEDIIKDKMAKGWEIQTKKAFKHAITLVLSETLNSLKGAKLRFELISNSASINPKRFQLSSVSKLIPKTPLAKIEYRFTNTLIAQEGPKRDTFVLERGEYNRPIGEALEPDVISVMGEMPKGAPKNRLGLAQWLTSPNHPTVSRVLVNRIWQRVFGTGLVRTSEEFGLQGEQPTHPELLDWLAVSLQENKWDLKKTLKMMVLSQTFMQSSQWRKDLTDPENKLYARGPSFRLDAEVLRDMGLWTSGLLDPHMGGEGVKPYQPAGMWESIAHPSSDTKDYKKDEGSKLYRRSLYVYWKRTSPHPMMNLFDAPSREVSCVNRSRTNTPLQSLALLNETQRIEMSRMLAEALLKEANDDQSRLEMIFKRITSRSPSTAETQICLKLLAQMKTKFSDSPDDAKQLLSTGDKPRQQQLDIIDHAAWTQVSAMLMASDLALLLY
ncbi:PSD1 and planctomycete cytochrome C domain-containing protein [Lentisphaera profundi]|uniref:PSD1 and planctomycete cytochrome C domain-containing protein n=1 Tax=Lentisphaera profundi TaxID=1658616 RepID=A0ABY7W310_9BACT|nr:PSD1 and planctomycete cytochrome C domain-containing protein [Lentisphaera profundi]WDE99369.1 PSD1 and planctomycete cytochrome C domain-containing protein [Lentisphaera profundi]